MVTDRGALDGPELGVELEAALLKLYPKEFVVEKTKGLVGNAATVKAIEDGVDPKAIATSWKAGLDTFRARREGYLLYR